MLGVNRDGTKILNPKSVVISGDVHELFRDFCKSKGLKISFVTEELFLEKMKQAGYIIENENKDTNK